MPKVGHKLPLVLPCMPASLCTWDLTYATPGAVGLDLAAHCRYKLLPGETAAVATGWCVEIPEGFEGQVRPRSSLSLDGVQVQLGTIDADYRGEIRVIVYNASGRIYDIKYGDRVAQLVIAPVIRAAPNRVASLTPTVRNTKGFGSTGR